jgi:hypothetical protein
MENLTFIHRGQFLSKRIVGGIMIIISIGEVLTLKDSMSILGWLSILGFLFLGAINFTRFSGSDKTSVGYGEGTLKIMWRGWIKEVKIPEVEIEKITIRQSGIVISRKGKKPVSLGFYLLDKEQKPEVYAFLIEYARQKNIVLVR